MARMIPDIIPDTIENNGERLFYSYVQALPDDFTVIYSYKYYYERRDEDKLGEADFIIVHPKLGYVVVEVKQGDIRYNNGIWYEFKSGDYAPLHKDPVEQARNAMFEILTMYKKAARGRKFPLGIRFALCFPECMRLSGIAPPNLREDSIWTFNDLENLQNKIVELFSRQGDDAEAGEILINQVLAPRFQVFATLEDKIMSFHKTSLKVLTEEQERILDETEEDKRKIFYGSAGTGKTFVAIEKARRLAKLGKKVFLTCYNKNLVALYDELKRYQLIKALNFHDYIYNVLRENGFDLHEPESSEDYDTFFNETLPQLAFDYYSSLDPEDKFDAIIIDEGQDFKEEWLLCLEAMNKDDGEFYIFADRNQNIFGNGLDSLKDIGMSKHRLTINLRNTEKIAQWLQPYTGESRVRCRLQNGLPVNCFAWAALSEEKSLIEKEIGRLVSQGLAPNRITIVSSHKKENSSLAGLDKIREWPLVDVREAKYGIQFSTVRAFKGLEADVVFLIGVKEGSRACTPADVYVGASRARFLLYVFHHKDWKSHPCAAF